MITKSIQTILKSIINKYGDFVQIDICIEECSELIKALLKMRRNEDISRVPVLKKDIIEEIADVNIMIEQLKIIYDCEKEVDDEITRKLIRQIERIKSGE